jgi:hypothetical protein
MPPVMAATVSVSPPHSITERTDLVVSCQAPCALMVPVGK